MPSLSDDDLPDPLLIQHVWRVLSRWGVPVMMSLAYVFLAATSETNNTGRMWMLVGLVFVMVVWFTFREMTETAAMSRALAVGEIAQLETLSHRGLAAHRKPARRARPLVARAFAHLLRGQHAEAVAALDTHQLAIDPATAAWLGPLGPLASAIRVSAAFEQGHPIDRAHVLRSPAAPALGWLIDGLLAAQDGQPDQARALLARVGNDIRVGPAIRELAARYQARLAA